MKRAFICCVLFMAVRFVGASHAATLFEENWDSGAIDPGVWALSPAAQANSAFVVIDAVDGVSGDKALMYNGFGSWHETIASVATYNRDNAGDGLVIEYSTWVEGGLGAPAQGFNGPFHNPNQVVRYDSIEFGTDWNWPFHGWSENKTFNGGNSLSLLHTGSFEVNPNEWQSRFGHSLGKVNNPSILRPNGAMKVRYTLGATQGGMIEWFNEITQQWVLEGDYRDGALGSHTQGSSSFPTVRLGWLTLGNAGGTGNSNTNLDDQTGVARDGIFIDDILVYAGSPGGGGVAGDYDGDGVVTAADYTVWADSFGNPDESALGGNGDGLNGVDKGDYDVWAVNFDSVAGTAASASVVPEPGTVLLVLWGAACLAGRRKFA